MEIKQNYFGEQIKNHILNKYDKSIRILDVSAGNGFYSDLLKSSGYENIDCVESQIENIKLYNLRQKYKNITIGDLLSLDINFINYDLIIIDDVLADITIEDINQLISKMKYCDIIVGVPFHNLNKKQNELNLLKVLENYEGFYPLCLKYDYGFFTNELNSTVFLDETQHQIQNENYTLLETKFDNLKLEQINPEIKTITSVTPEITKKPNTFTLEKGKTTIVTGLWDLGRGKISESFSRGYDNYLQKFSELLKTDIPMYIFIDKSDEEFIWKHRKRENTVLNFMSLDELKGWFNFTNITNQIRQKESWYSQAGWLKDSPQCSLEGYNPLVMSKMFMLNNVSIWNPFESEYFFWIDAGITNTVHQGYFYHDKVFDNLPDFINTNKDFVFLTYPYEGGEEIHGFEREAIARYSKTDYVKYVCRGGFFGGKKERVNEINGLYYSMLNATLSDGYMGTEESVFTILMHNYPELITQYGIEGNGLVWPFFETLKDKDYKKNIILKKGEIDNNLNINKVGLYVLTFNSPQQFWTLIKSMLEYDKEFITKTKKFLLDNSTDESTFEEYSKLCKEYDFEHIKKDNLGICGGRQFIAKHFDETDLDYYIFSEDDMFFQNKPEETCRNGFNRYCPNLYRKTLEIIKKENYDFIKYNFSEFYGDNGTQWSWYNVPQSVREEFWPEKTKLPQMGLDPNAPRTKFNNIKSHNGLPYADGEIYYCNWTQILSRPGNKKMFIDTTWAHPFENTWMSHHYQLTKKGDLKGGLLLLTPVEHDRFDHYSRELRKES
jgi:hypothetical protein